jgi:hypothetical protein
LLQANLAHSECSARQAVAIARGGDGQGQDPIFPAEVIGVPPTAPNLYTDGGLTNPTNHHWSCAGFGLWLPRTAENDIHSIAIPSVVPPVIMSSSMLVSGVNSNDTTNNTRLSEGNNEQLGSSHTTDGERPSGTNGEQPTPGDDERPGPSVGEEPSASGGERPSGDLQDEGNLLPHTLSVHDEGAGGFNSHSVLHNTSVPEETLPNSAIGMDGVSSDQHRAGEDDELNATATVIHNIAIPSGVPPVIITQPVHVVEPTSIPLRNTFCHSHLDELGSMMWGGLAGLRASSTRTEIAAAVMGLTLNLPLYIGSDSQSMIAKATYLIHKAHQWNARTGASTWTIRNPCGKAWDSTRTEISGSCVGLPFSHAGQARSSSLR